MSKPEKTPPINPPGQDKPKPDKPDKPAPSVPFFRTGARQWALLAEISQWEGTRFWRGAAGKAKKGVGADCVSFVEKVMVNLGAMKPIVWPSYITWGGGEVMLELLLKSMEQLPEFRRIWSPGDEMPELMMGDIFARSVPLRDGTTDYHHLAIFIGDNTLVHMRRRGISRANVEDRNAVRKLQAIYRIYEPVKPSSSEGR